MQKNNHIYNLPEGWIWTTIGEIAILSSGGTPSRSNSSYFRGDIPWVKSGELNNNIIQDTEEKISQEALEDSSAKIIPANTLLIALYGSTVGKLATLGIPASTNQAVAAIITTSNFNQRFLFYYLKKNRDKLLKKRKGGAQPNISLKILSEFNIPLPRLNEQNLIVAKIEQLFSELDHAETGLKIAQKQLKIYRQSLLKSAFEGKLTNKNIEEKNLPKEWKWIKVSDICDVVRGGSPRPAGDSRYYNGNIPFLKVKDITKDNNMYLNTYEFTIKEAGLRKTRQISRNTLLLSNSGATLGVPKICMIDATMNDGIAAFLNLDSKSIMYMYYFWLSKTRELRSINMGAAQPNLNTIIIKNYDIPFCSFEEQSKIVQELGSKFALIENLENTIDKGLKKLDTFRQSILKNAFEGKLVPQYSSDESASKLLEQIIKEKANFLENIKVHLKLQPKIKKMIEDDRSIIDILKEAGKPVQAKELWQSSEFKDNIDAFYAQLKKLIENNTILEIPRQGKESFIKLIQENENK